MEYHEVQKIAKDTIEFAKKNIKSGMSLIEVRKVCENKMLELGADSFWYWDISRVVVKESLDHENKGYEFRNSFRKGNRTGANQ